jgi:hypothetical protein
MTITQRQLDIAKKTHRHAIGDDADRNFAVLYLQREYDCSADEAISHVSVEHSTSGLTGFYLDRQRRNLILLVSHWGDDPEALIGAFGRLVSTGMPRIFDEDSGARVSAHADVFEALLSGGTSPAPDAFVDAIRSELLEERVTVQQVLIHLLFNGDPADIQGREAVAQLRADLDQHHATVERYFGRPVRLASVFISERTRRRNAQVAQPVPRLPLGLTQPLTVVGPSGETMLVGFARLADLGAMYRAMGPELLDRNIRAGLSEDASPNRSITDALRRMTVTGDGDPRLFAFHHNGVTVAALECEARDDGVVLTAPRLLNGAQTVTTFARFSEEHAERMSAERTACLTVLCKVITRASPDFVTQVTINNNRQNPVMPWHLRANDLIQVRLQDWFARQVGIYYERQQNSFAALEDEDLERLGIVESKRIELLKLAATLLASDGRVDKMSHMREVFENDRLYSEVFHEGRLAANARQVIVCYKMQRSVAKLLKVLQESGAEGFAFLYRARNLVWALLCQGFLNDSRTRRRWSEQYGGDLTLTQTFRDELAKMTRTRLRPILDELLCLETYRRQIDLEKYGFLGTRVVFTRAMEIAREQFSWEHKSLL